MRLHESAADRSGDRTTDGPLHPDLTPEQEQRLLDLTREYLAALEAGQRPSRAEYLARYPELAGMLAEHLESLELVRALSPRLQPGSKRSRSDYPQLGLPLGDFRLVREIGRGGMGVVYEAVQLSLGRRVALKVLPFAAALDEKHLQRFRNEAQAAALLHHTNIVPVYAVGCDRGVHYYAMQLIEGQPLTVLLSQLRALSGIQDDKEASGDADSWSLATGLLSGRLPAAPSEEAKATPLPAGVATSRSAARALPTTGKRDRAFYRMIARLALQAVEALEHAHQMGIVHRDVKPANLLLDRRGHLWITDFGLALLVSNASITMTGDILGTIRYMSPEQAAGDRVLLDHRTDIYSLGATLYELLTLTPAFTGSEHMQLLQRIRLDDPPAPRSLDRNIPVELETIVVKAMAKAPADRYASAAAFAEDLQRFLNDKPILARRPTLPDRVRKWSRRHPAVVGAGVVLLLVVVLALLGHSWRLSLEHAEVEAALQRESERAEEASRLYLKAREAIDRLARVAEEELSEHPHTVTAHRRLLEVALDAYQQFLDERRDDPKAQAELAQEQQRVRQLVADLVSLQTGPMGMLLESDAVRRDLGLGAAQEQSVSRLRREWSDERHKLHEELRGLESDRRRQILAARAREHEQALAAILSPAQLQRLRQIDMQFRGTTIFRDPEVVQKLGLTTEQRGALRRLEPSGFPPPGPRRGMHFSEETVERKRQGLQRAEAVLTEEQRTRLQALIGKPLEHTAEAMPQPPQEQRGP